MHKQCLPFRAGIKVDWTQSEASKKALELTSSEKKEPDLEEEAPPKKRKKAEKEEENHFGTKKASEVEEMEVEMTKDTKGKKDRQKKGLASDKRKQLKRKRRKKG